jgi:hypothetical protein
MPKLRPPAGCPDPGGSAREEAGLSHGQGDGVVGSCCAGDRAAPGAEAIGAGRSCDWKCSVDLRVQVLLAPAVARQRVQLIELRVELLSLHR